MLRKFIRRNFMEGEVKGKMHEIKGKSKELKGELKSKVKETEGKIDEVKGTAAEKKEVVIGKANEFKESAVNKKDELLDKAGEFKESAAEKKDEFSDKASEFKESAAEKKDEVSDKASETRKSAENMLNDIVDTIRQKQKEFGKSISDYTTTFQKPLTDVIETSDAIIIKVDLPGLNKEDLEIDIGENSVDILAKFPEESDDKDITFVQKERNYGNTRRTIDLPANVKYKEATANFVNSILTIRIPKIRKESYKLTIN